MATIFLQFLNGIFANGKELRINEELGQRGPTAVTMLAESARRFAL
jgi:hypothetical protein